MQETAKLDPKKLLGFKLLTPAKAEKTSCIATGAKVGKRPYSSLIMGAKIGKGGNGGGGGGGGGGDNT